MATDEKRVGAVYVGWSTFKRALEPLTEAMPNRIDRTVFPGLAGGVQGQLLTGLKFLGLVEEDGKPTAALLALAVRDEEKRKEQTGKILRASYPELFNLDLTKTTPGELRDKMGESYGVTGATLDRALRFFISAAEYAEIPLSAHVSKARPNGPGRPRRRAAAKPRAESPVTPAAPAAAAGASKTIKLASGDTLTLSASAGLFSLGKQDREFVFDLIDKLEEYEKASTPAGSSEEP